MAKKLLLVVDDEPTVAKLIARLFFNRDFSIMTAEDGEEALEILKRRKPVLMLLDVNMPKLDGLEVLRTSLEIYPDMPVIIVTGELNNDTAKRMMDAGARDYITKPFDMDYLETTVLAHSL